MNIDTATVADAWQVFAATPEFHFGDITREVMHDRLSGPDTLILAAFDDGVPVAFKAGYDRYGDGSFYSWLGSVLPAARGHDLAQRLIDAQEAWARERGFVRIFVKTRNRFVGMRITLARAGYDIVGFERGEDRAEARLIHVKDL